MLSSESSSWSSNATSSCRLSSSSGTDSCHAVGTAVTTRERIVAAAQGAIQMQEAAAAATMPTANGLSQCVPAQGFSLTLLSGRVVLLPPPEAGWATNRRLPVTTPTSRMYRFAAWAASISAQGKQLKNQEASRAMARIGTAEFTAEWPDDSYVQSMRTADGQPYFSHYHCSRMEIFEHSTLKALLTKGKAYCERLLASALAREQKAAAKVAGKRAAPAGAVMTAAAY